MPRKSDTEEARARNREYQRIWREKNIEVQRARVNANTKKSKARARAFVDEYKTQHPCKCGETRLPALDFHHRDPLQKEKNIGRAINGSWGLKRLKFEMDKCDVICSNCHRVLHDRERNN